MLSRDQLKHLDAVFNPQSIAVVGANDQPEKVGYNLLQSILEGGFQGRVYPVHPRHREILGLPVFQSLAVIGKTVDLAVIALNERSTLEAVQDCLRLGIKGAVCIAGGYGEIGPAGQELEARLQDLARDGGLILIGPNTLGMINTHAALYSTFYPLRLPRGGVSFITQSGGVGLALLQKCLDEGLGISKWIGVGNRAVLEFADYLQYLAEDETTTVIGVFLEGTEDARNLVQTAARTLLRKPVVIYKVGGSGAVEDSALTHTGTLAGSHRVYMDIFRQFEIPTAGSLGELVAAVKALSLAPLPAGGGVGILTHTAGPAIIMQDELARRGRFLPRYAPETIQKVKEVIGPNPPVVLRNPLDVAGLGFLPPVYGRIAEIAIGDPGIDILAAVYCLHRNWRFPTEELLRIKERSDKPLVACYISTLSGAARDVEMMSRHGVPLYITAEEAAWGIHHLLAFRSARIGAMGREG